MARIPVSLVRYRLDTRVYSLLQTGTKLCEKLCEFISIERIATIRVDYIGCGSLLTKILLNYKLLFFYFLH